MSRAQIQKKQKKILVGIYYTEPGQKERAERLAGSLALPVITDSTGYDFVLSFTRDRLSLSMPNDSSLQGYVYVEFVGGRTGYRRQHAGKELLLKAVGLHKNRPPSILDATGGMGRDCFLMAGHGCRVHAFERNRIVAAMLEDGLQRAENHPDTRITVERIRLSTGDCLQFLRDCPGSAAQYDVIYLDPMFPQRKKSALVKKEMQILNRLVGYETDAEQLLTEARAAAGKRVVVKRPKAVPPLADSTPSYSLRGKTTRFDVYIIPGRK
jgi:16S rRNA (guanine1516-N2)-methyltransferase